MTLPGMALEELHQWYDAVRPGEMRQSLHARLLTGGRSNLTYEVSDGTASWVVRRPPLGHVQATAHDMSREFSVMSALAPTPVPVPRPLAFCADESVLGAQFYVMENVPGTAYRSGADLDLLGPERTAALASRVINVLADLHAVDPDEVGLGRLGRSDGFLERQVRRWGRQLEGSATTERPLADRLLHWLRSRVADPGLVADGWSGVVHGDYRLDNCLVDADDTVRAVVDWEMATLGDTRTDLALLLVYDQLPTLGVGDVVPDVSAAAGYPSGDMQVEGYARAAGRHPGDLGFHVALAFFKLAVILEGIHFRHLQGQTVGDGFDGLNKAVDRVLAAGLDAAKGA